MKAVCFGEVLWDVLPTERVAGGAPMNVAIRLQSLGIDSAIISRIGNDIAGQLLIDIIQQKQVNTSLIQTDFALPTGEVLVHLDETGTASYNIINPSAWDMIEYNDVNCKAVAAADVFVFGSLSCRNEVSKNTLFRLLDHAAFKVFDVNLRAPFYSMELIEMLMNRADFIKLNDEELMIVAAAIGATFTNIEASIQFIAAKTNTEAICVTKGKDGAVLYINQNFYYHSGFKVTVADTIGAGDSFLAALLSKLLQSVPHDELLPFACAVVSMVASKQGANPQITTDEVEHLMKDKNQGV